MGFFARVLGRKTTLAELTKLSEERIPPLLRDLEKLMPISKLFPGENMPQHFVDSFKSGFADIEQKEARKAQSQLAKRHILIGLDDIELYNVMSSAAISDEMIQSLATFVGLGNPFFKHLSSFDNVTVEVFKAHLSRFKILAICQMEALRMVYGIEFPGVEAFKTTEEQYRLITREHCRKILAESLLLASKDSEGVFAELANEYNFQEANQRRSLLNDFLNGVENDNEAQIDRVCEEFPKLPPREMITSSNVAIYC